MEDTLMKPSTFSHQGSSSSSSRNARHPPRSPEAEYVFVEEGKQRRARPMAAEDEAKRLGNLAEEGDVFKETGVRGEILFQEAI
jgi:hypothetical protein